eukprot:s9005_g4.t1
MTPRTVVSAVIITSVILMGLETDIQSPLWEPINDLVLLFFLFELAAHSSEVLLDALRLLFVAAVYKSRRAWANGVFCQITEALRWSPSRATCCQSLLQNLSAIASPLQGLRDKSERLEARVPRLQVNIRKQGWLHFFTSEDAAQLYS